MQLKAKITDLEESARLARGLMRVRTWEMKNLPHNPSSIAFDLFVLVAAAHLMGEPLTLKRIFHSLPYSERGVRNVLEEFVASGWCSVAIDNVDRRVRLVQPTPRLLETFHSYQAILRREICEA